jgi:NitT/TauT family transport system permease protein
MLRQPIARRWHLMLGVVSFLTLFGAYTAWSWVRQQDVPEDRTVPNWSQIYREGLLEAFTPESTGRVVMWEDTKASVYRLAVGLALSLVVSVSLGLLMGCYEPVEAFFLPPLAFLSKIPATAILVLFLIVMGFDDWFYVAIILFVVVPTFAQMIFHSAKEDVPEELLFKARTLGASQLACIWDVIYKIILPRILEGTRLSVGPALVILYAAEYLRGNVGFGTTGKLINQKGVAAMPLLFVQLVFLGLFGLGVDLFFRWAQRKLCPWYGR